MRKIMLLCLAVLLVLSIAGCGGNTKNVTVDYGSSDLYETKDIDKAVSIVKSEFKSMNGCVLNALTYAGDEKSKRELEYQNREKVQYSDCIILKSSFDSPKKNSGAWEAGCEYKWDWIIVKEDGGNWFLLDKGYG